MHNSHTCRPAAALQIVNKIGSKLLPENFFQQSMPKAPRAYWSCGSVLEAHRRARTERFWLALIGADGKIWSAMKMLLKWNFCCSLPSSPTLRLRICLRQCSVSLVFFLFFFFLPSCWQAPPSLNRKHTLYNRGQAESSAKHKKT